MPFIELFVFGGVLAVLWFTVLAALYAAFTTSYLLCAWGWQAWKWGKRLWTRS